ncbi:hypothetical protein [uncultured Ruegeria sp.]|uniref:hypothetical protein n=1 Tax=uncultured Ruegeria sp. TaxID=259304 RepID=UPI00261429C9|nr:hypothetical protein [uncultured Ruegeria sp.]
MLIAFRGLDFFFLPHQQDSIHSYFLKLQKWLLEISQNERNVEFKGFFGVVSIVAVFQLFLLMSSLILVPVILIGALFHWEEAGGLGVYEPEMGWSGLAAGLMYVASIILLNMLVIRVFLARFYVTISAYTSERLTRLGLLIIAPFVVLLFGYRYLSIKFGFADVIGGSVDALIFFSILLLLYFAFSVVSITSVLSNIKSGKKTIAVKLFLFIAIFFVRRIAAYQKGALAAIALVGTIALGTIKLFFS